MRSGGDAALSKAQAGEGPKPPFSLSREQMGLLPVGELDLAAAMRAFARRPFAGPPFPAGGRDRDASAVVLNGNYALDAGLTPVTDALKLESVDAAPANQLVVRSGDKDNESLKKLAEIMNSADFKSYIETTWSDGSVIPAF